MHNQRTAIFPRVRELLNSANRVPHRPIHRNQASCFSVRADSCSNVSRSSIVQEVLFMHYFSHRDRGASGFGECAMHFAQNSLGGVLNVRPENTNGLPASML